MGILSKIKDKIFKKSAAKSSNAAPVSTAQYVPTEPVNIPEPEVIELEPVDVEAILEAAVAAKSEKLNWRTSIVDLLKALDLDSSLAARKELAADLNYQGTAADGSAEKNIWLHKALMKSLAENGGKVPTELLS